MKIIELENKHPQYSVVKNAAQDIWFSEAVRLFLEYVCTILSQK